MGIEPTRDPYEPHTGFEDQGHHQAPFTSETRILWHFLASRPSSIDYLDTVVDTC